MLTYEEKLAKQDIDKVLAIYMNHHPETTEEQQQEIYKNICKTGTFADIEVRYFDNNIQAKEFRTPYSKVRQEKGYDTWHNITDNPSLLRTDIPFSAFPNYTFEMYNGYARVRPDEYRSRYGTIRFDDSDNPYLIDVTVTSDVSMFVLGDKLKILYNPMVSSLDSVKIFEIPDGWFLASFHHKKMKVIEALRFLKRMDISVPQLKIARKRALEIIQSNRKMTYDEQKCLSKFKET